MATSNLFKKGHRIGWRSSSSNFPRFDRNANTGGPIGADTPGGVRFADGPNTSEHPSHVTLPVVPRG